VLDDCNFHECVNLDNFDMAKSVTLRPPDGEVGCQPRTHYSRTSVTVADCLLYTRRANAVYVDELQDFRGGRWGCWGSSIPLAARNTACVSFYVSFLYVLLLRRTVTQSLASGHAAIGALKHPLPFRVSAVVEESMAPGRCAPAAHKRAWH